MAISFNAREPGFQTLHEMAPGLYTYLTPFLFQGKSPINNRGVVVHVPQTPGAKTGGCLVIINPAELTPEVKASLHQLEEQLQAKVRYLLSPGDWHYMFIGSYLGEFPEAAAYVPPGRIPSKNPGYPYTLMRVADDYLFPELAPTLKVLSFKGISDLMDPTRQTPRYELVFHHPSSRTMISGDVFYYRNVATLPPELVAMGMQARVVAFHFYGWKMIADARKVQHSLSEILTWDFDHYVSFHGEPGNILAQGAKADLQKMLAWAKQPPADFVAVG